MACVGKLLNTHDAHYSIQWRASWLVNKSSGSEWRIQIKGMHGWERERETLRTSLVSNQMNYYCSVDKEVVERIEERIVEDSLGLGTVAEDIPVVDTPVVDIPAVDNRVVGILAVGILAVDILLLPFRIPPADNLNENENEKWEMSNENEGIACMQKEKRNLAAVELRSVVVVGCNSLVLREGDVLLSLLMKWIVLLFIYLLKRK